MFSRAFHDRTESTLSMQGEHRCLSSASASMRFSSASSMSARAGVHPAFGGGMHMHTRTCAAAANVVGWRR